MILPKHRDRRFITIRRGGTLTDSDHQLLALWAATCAEHVVRLFESVQPSDLRPRRAIEQARAWGRGEITMSEAREAAGMANAAARDLSGAARHAAYAAAQAGGSGGARRCARLPVRRRTRSRQFVRRLLMARVRTSGGSSAGGSEGQLPDAIRELVLDDQRLRNDICWSAFDC